MDTQWPRFEVFAQDGLSQPHRNTGSVHAPDAEMALQNARDVFVRRPECTSLWVAPQNQVYAWTSAALQADAGWQSETVVLSRSTPYEVFSKQGQRQSDSYVTYVGTVEARSPAEALRLALAQFNSSAVTVWWLVPASAILRSARGDAPSLFQPAVDKTYRRPNEYKVQTEMRETPPPGPEAETGAGTGSTEHKP